MQNDKTLLILRYSYFILFLFFLLSCQGQDDRLIEKKWKVDVNSFLTNLSEEVKTQYSEEDLRLMKEMMSNIYIEFRADGKVLTNIDGEEKIGDWDFENKILTIDFEGVDDQLTAMELTESKLKLGRGSQEMAITFIPAE